MEKKYIIAGKFIDGTGSEAKENIGILIEDDKIKRIDDAAKIPEDCKVYDFSNKTIMPGLINAHVHLAYEIPGLNENEITDVDVAISSIKELKEYLESGVTHIRVCGASTYLDVKLRDAMRKGLIKGPSIIAAGRGITMTGGSGHRTEIEADGVDECRKAARFVIKQGADFIKIVSTGSIGTKGILPGSPQLSCEELKAAIDEAHKAGKKVGSHAHGSEGIKNAVLAGIDSIEHGSYLTDEIIDLMKERGTYLVPTLTVMYLSEIERQKGGVSEEVLKKSKGIKEANSDSFRRAYKAGIKIVTGTDVGTKNNTPDKSWYELKLMVENGVTPMEAIMAATKNASELLGISDCYGTLEEGKMCDLIVMSENPLENIEAVSKIDTVFKHGEEINFGSYIV